jgi:hypothetical protein
MSALGDRESEDKRNARAKRIQAGHDNAIKALMSHTETRAWMWDLLTECRVYSQVFDRSALQMAFNDGSRNVGLKLIADIMRVAPDSYIQMSREAEVNKDD